MNKDFVLYPEALELKSLGFDEPCIGWATMQYADVVSFGNKFKKYHETELPTRPFGVPLYQQAFRWFRDTYNMDAWVQPFVAQNSRGKLYLPDESYSYLIFRDGVFVCDGADFLEPEDAELACLKKLIEIVKTNKNG